MTGVVYFIWDEDKRPQFAVVPRSEIRCIQTRMYSMSITLLNAADIVELSIEPDNEDPERLIRRIFATLTQAVDTDITWTMDKDGDWTFEERRPT